MSYSVPNFQSLCRDDARRHGYPRCDMLLGPCSCGQWHCYTEPRFLEILLDTPPATPHTGQEEESLPC